MSHQASLIKLKEQIEAAKRSLSEMPSMGGDNGVADGDAGNINSDFSSCEKAAFTNTQQTVVSAVFDKTVVDLPNIVALEAAKVIAINPRETTFDKEKTENLYSSEANNPFTEFHFFYRKKQLVHTPVTGLNVHASKNVDMPVEDTAHDWLFEDVNCRLEAI